MHQEDVAHWFFRLNGCLTTRNFIVHPEQRGRRPQLTEADLLAIRFPWRQEQHMVDHVMFARDRTTLFLVEVKRRGRCQLNGPWANRANLARVLAAVGCYADGEVRTATEGLVDSGRYESTQVDTLLVAVAAIRSNELAEAMPNAVQLVWHDLFSFIYSRMYDYRDQKYNHQQWDAAGHRLYQAALDAGRNFAQFEVIVRDQFFQD